MREDFFLARFRSSPTTENLEQATSPAAFVFAPGPLLNLEFVSFISAAFSTRYRLFSTQVILLPSNLAYIIT